MEPLPTGMAPGGQPRGMIHAILFDIYGTLIISGSGDIGIAEGQCRPSDELASLFRHFQIPWSPEQISQKLFADIRDHHKRSNDAGIDYPEVRIDRIWQRILNWPDIDRVRQLAEAYETIVNPTYPMPGLDQVLDTLRRRNMPLGIISNAQFFTPRLFKTLLGARPENLGFSRDLTFYSFELERAKPSVYLYQHAAAKLQTHGIAPEAVLYVGNDIRNDIRPAQAVGFQTALFAGDRRSLRLREEDPVCRHTTPDLIITDLRQLLDLSMGAPRSHPDEQS